MKYDGIIHIFIKYIGTPFIRNLIIRNANYPERFGPSGKHFRTVFVLHLLRL